jgi:protein-disulfide isomerase
MALPQETKLFLGIMAATAVVIVAATAILSQPAKPLPKSELAPSSAPSRGPVNAKTWLVEFSDFQCPACREYSGTVDALAKAHPDSLFVAYRYYPLPQHPYAEPAAEAAEAAAKQGKFWEMADQLFAHQDTLSDATVASIAGQLGLDMNAFTRDRQSDAVAQKIADDVRYGDQISLSVTPTFYLNGMKLELTSVADLKQQVEAAIKTAR